MKGFIFDMNGTMIENIALTNMHDAADFAQYDNVLFIIKDYTDNKLKKLF